MKKFCKVAFIAAGCLLALYLFIFFSIGLTFAVLEFLK